ncbi:hypothetical protein [Streptomyces sp. DSM 41634]|uniref:hypothetical protein n=1 Tax=Streptomyces sp. DSM 41634 TaxID=3448656 RepID=UPI0040402E87
MGRLDAAGTDVARILTDAHQAGVGVDQAVAAVTAAARRVPAPAAPAAAPVREGADRWAAPTSTDAKRSWGSLTEGLDVPRDLGLGNRPRALKQLRVQPAAHSQMVSMVGRDTLLEQEAGLLVHGPGARACSDRRRTP